MTPGNAEQPVVDATGQTTSRSSDGEAAHRQTFPIVGIGASAGGLEALTAFFRALAADLGMAYVLAPHLDPQRESAMSQILSRSTAMPVVQIEQGMRLVPDHVYVIPPNCDLAVHQGVLHIGDREQPRTINATIISFFVLWPRTPDPTPSASSSPEPPPTAPSVSLPSRARAASPSPRTRNRHAMKACLPALLPPAVWISS